MDESLQELENELKRLTPRRPSAVLLERLDRELTRVGAPAAPVRPKQSSATSFTSWKWMGWRLAAAAAVVALAVALLVRPKPSAVAPSPAEPGLARNEAVQSPAVMPAEVPSPSPERLRPVRAANVLVGLADDGLVTLPDESPARQLRYRYIDTYTWKNPATNASLRWSVPREEVRVVPVRFN